MARLPATDQLARNLDARGLPAAIVMDIARAAIARARDDGSDPAQGAAADIAAVARRRNTTMINATGVLLHTNLGRAIWPRPAIEAAQHAAGAYTPVELDPATGRRHRRDAYVEQLLRAVTGAETGMVVNNNAGALLLALAAIGRGGDVIVSRGELIEIGGSFRLPELMAASGARLVEVGTTNRTRLSDYAGHISDAAAVLKVHPSNYRIEGFSEEVGYAALGELAADHGVPFVADVGSGLLDARMPWLDGHPPAWAEEEAAVRQTLDAGAGVVLFSGDKLLGGPQSGFAVGSKDLIEAMRTHPIARALRCDGSTLAAVSATLELYADGRAGEIPFWQMAAMDSDTLAHRCRQVAAAAGCGEIVTGQSTPGAGTVPGAGIESPVLAVAGGDDIWRRLLTGDPPVLARRSPQGVLLDLRAVAPADDPAVASALGAACRS